MKNAPAGKNPNESAEHTSAFYHQSDNRKQHYLEQLLLDFGGNSAENQRKRIILALARASLTTPEIRKHLDVMEVAARIWELRHVDGHGIDKVMVEDRTDAGRKHKVALYTLTHYVPEVSQ